MNHDTIAAIATPIGGGIGIIRISGPQAEPLARRIFQTAGGNAADGNWNSHHLYYGRIVDCVNNQTIDEVLLAVMRAPHSYTREDVVEIQSHGGAAVLSQILELVVRLGARPAQPGEFTRRAFLNGRIDLSQAEAVADLINARSRRALEIANSHLSGQLKRQVERWTERLQVRLAELQAEIEFGDQLEADPDRQALCKEIENELLAPIAALLEDFEHGHALRDGVRLSIAGRPNVGKSSLLNRLLGQEKAIVTAFAGTTRDPIEQACAIRGIPVTLVDTAGIRSSDDPIECLGVGKAREAIGAADIVLFVVESTAPMNQEDRVALETARGSKLILVVNKIDLVEGRPYRLPGPHEPAAAVVGVSALNGEGIAELEQVIAEQCIATDKLSSSMLIPTVRQKVELETASGSLQRARDGLLHGIGEDLVVCDLSDAVQAFQRITGEQAGPDLLDRIFSRFCIGK